MSVIFVKYWEKPLVVPFDQIPAFTFWWWTWFSTFMNLGFTSNIHLSYWNILMKQYIPIYFLSQSGIVQTCNYNTYVLMLKLVSINVFITVHMANTHTHIHTHSELLCLVSQWLWLLLLFGLFRRHFSRPGRATTSAVCLLASSPAAPQSLCPPLAYNSWIMRTCFVYFDCTVVVFVAAAAAFLVALVVFIESSCCLLVQNKKSERMATLIFF